MTVFKSQDVDIVPSSFTIVVNCLFLLSPDI